MLTWRPRPSVFGCLVFLRPRRGVLLGVPMYVATSHCSDVNCNGWRRRLHFKISPRGFCLAP
eukprot:11207943-Lingulodinium_polyedra.AAC.1